MQFFNHVRPCFMLSVRITMWAVIGLLVVVGLFKSTPAWAEPAACPGNLSIPITPQTLFLRFGGPPATYQASLCEDPDAPVNVTAAPSAAGKVTISPANFALTSTQPQTVAVSVANGHPADQPFTVIISHTATSDDPEFDYGSLNVPRVTAYYSPPVAVDDSAAPLFGQGIAVNVLANDIDRRGDGLTLPANTIVTNPAHGTVSVNANQTIQYTPTTGYAGPDSFTYRVEDATGNSDIGTVTISVAAENVENPQIEDVDPEEGGDVQFESSVGTVQVDVPALVGIPAGSSVVLVFGEVETPSGDVEDAPVAGGTFSGIVLKLQLLVNGVPVTPGQLSEPLKLSFVLPDEFAAGLNGARVIIAVWNGTAWVTEGVVVESLIETAAYAAAAPTALHATSITISTTVFGEFALFTQQVLFMPMLERQ